MARGGPIGEGPPGCPVGALAAAQGDCGGMGSAIRELVGVPDQQYLESEQSGKEQDGKPGDCLDGRLATDPSVVTGRDRSTPPATFREAPERDRAA